MVGHEVIGFWMAKTLDCGTAMVMRMSPLAREAMFSRKVASLPGPNWKIVRDCSGRLGSFWLRQEEIGPTAPCAEAEKGRRALVKPQKSLRVLELFDIISG
jgi:hypothetical protein